MKKPTITEIKNSVKQAGGEFAKCDFYLNGQDAYKVSGETYTKSALISGYAQGYIG